MQPCQHDGSSWEVFLLTASDGQSAARIGLGHIIMLDLTSNIWYGAILPKKAQVYCAKPAQIHFGPGWLTRVLAKMDLVQMQASVRESLGPLWS